MTRSVHAARWRLWRWTRKRRRARRSQDPTITAAKVAAATALIGALVGGLAASGAAHLTARSSERLAEQNFLREQRIEAYAEFYIIANDLLHDPTTREMLVATQPPNRIADYGTKVKRLSDAEAKVTLTGDEETLDSAFTIVERFEEVVYLNDLVDPEGAQEEIDDIEVEIELFVEFARLALTPEEVD